MGMGIPGNIPFHQLRAIFMACMHISIIDPTSCSPLRAGLGPTHYRQIHAGNIAIFRAPAAARERGWVFDFQHGGIVRTAAFTLPATAPNRAR